MCIYILYVIDSLRILGRYGNIISTKNSIFKVSYWNVSKSRHFFNLKELNYIDRYRCTGSREMTGNNDDAIPVSIIDALSYIYHIPFHSTIFSSLSFFRIFLYSFYLSAGTQRGKGNLIFRFWNSQRKAKIWSASISRRECAPECSHAHFDHLFLPPNVSTIARKSWDLRVQEPRTEESAFISRLPVRTASVNLYSLDSSHHHGASNLWCIDVATRDSLLSFLHTASPFPSFVSSFFSLPFYGKIYVEEDSCSTKLDKEMEKIVWLFRNELLKKCWSSCIAMFQTCFKISCYSGLMDNF